MFAGLGKARPFFGRMQRGLKGQTEAVRTASPSPPSSQVHLGTLQAGWVNPPVRVLALGLGTSLERVWGPLLLLGAKRVREPFWSLGPPHPLLGLNEPFGR